MAVIDRNKKVFQSATANSHVNCQKKVLEKNSTSHLYKINQYVLYGYKMGLPNL